MNPPIQKNAGAYMQIWAVTKEETIMSKENAKKFFSELQTNEELKAKVQSTDPAEIVKIAADAGYNITNEELIEAEKELRKEQAAKTD